MAAWATADCEHEKQSRSVHSRAATIRAERVALGGKPQHPPTREAAWMTSPVAIAITVEMDRGTAVDEEHTSNRIAAVSLSACACCACGRFRRARIPGHPSSWMSRRSAWSPRWPTARAPATARLRSCNKVEPCLRTLPWYVLSHLWANDKMGLDGTGWPAVLPSPCLQLPVRSTARGLSLVSSLQRAWFLGLGRFPPAPSPAGRRRYIVTNLQCPCTPHAGLHIPYMLPRLPYSRPHEPKHSPASFKSSTSNR